MIARRSVPIPALVTIVLSLAIFATGACNKVPLLAPTGSTITLTSAAAALPANGSTTIIAQVLEAAGTPPQDGTLITFTTTLGSIQPSQAETNGGRVTVKFTSGTQSGTATITASSGGATVGANGAIKIAVGSAAVSGITLAATPSVVASTGGNSTIAATVGDSGGNPLSGVQVSFTTDAGSVSPTVATTDANGRAQTTLTTSRTAKVTATAGVTTSTAGTGGTTTTTAAPSATITVTVNATQAITIGTAAPASPTVGQTVSLPLTYATTSGASPITKVTVSWGDGVVAVSSGQPGVVTHSYSAAGSYVVQITGTDSTGDTSTTSTSISVGPRPRPSVGVTVSNDNPSVNTAVTFTVTASELNAGTSGAAVQSVHLDFGDGKATDLGSAGGAPGHTYTAAGTYTATATATDTNGRTATAQVTVTVGAGSSPPRPSVGVIVSNDNPAVNTAVTFTVTASELNAGTSGAAVQSVHLDFGDGKATDLGPTGGAPGHTYTAVGTYVASATATDTNGRTATAQVTVTVGGLVAKFTFSPTSPAALQQVFFNASDSTLTGTVTAYAWDFGDGEAPSRSVPTISHAFALAGTYKVRLTITQSNGQTATITNDVIVK